MLDTGGRPMSQSTGTNRSARAALAFVVALLLIGITKLPAGVGTHGRTGQTATASSISYRLGSDPNDSFTETVTGLTADTAGVNMRNAINATGRFTASIITDPEDPNAVSLDVKKIGGEDLIQLAVCKDVVEYSTVGVKLAAGKRDAVLSKPIALAANGIYRIRLNMWDTADYDVTFDTSQPANDTPAELFASISSSLTSNGFTVTDLGASCSAFGSGFATSGCFAITRHGDMVVSARVDVTDTGSRKVCSGLTVAPGVVLPPGPTQGIPTLSQYGMFALVALMTIAAIGLLRRRRASSV